MKRVELTALSKGDNFISISQLVICLRLNGKEVILLKTPLLFTF